MEFFRRENLDGDRGEDGGNWWFCRTVVLEEDIGDLPVEVEVVVRQRKAGPEMTASFLISDDLGVAGLLRVVLVAEKKLLIREYEDGLCCCGLKFSVVNDDVQKAFLQPEPPISSSLFRPTNVV